MMPFDGAAAAGAGSCAGLSCALNPNQAPPPAKSAKKIMPSLAPETNVRHEFMNFSASIVSSPPRTATLSSRAPVRGERSVVGAVVHYRPGVAVGFRL